MKKYVVKRGDTLGAIAKKFLGDANYYKLIAAENNIDNPDKISVGQELVIPDAKQSDDTVAHADTHGDSEDVVLSMEQLKEIMPRAQDADLSFYTGALNTVLPRYGITTPLRKAHFIAQIAHESGELKYRSENLNYSAKALRTVFGKYFTDDAAAEAYARQPEAIANKVYADRMGNGDEASGEGWRYRGRGLIQLTGKNNYEQCGNGIGKDLVSNPDALTEAADTSVLAACWYWDTHKLNEYADQDDIKTITKKINGGYNGLDDRQKYLDSAKKVIMDVS